MSEHKIKLAGRITLDLIERNLSELPFGVEHIDLHLPLDAKYSSFAAKHLLQQLIINCRQATAFFRLYTYIPADADEAKLREELDRPHILTAFLLADEVIHFPTKSVLDPQLYREVLNRRLQEFRGPKLRNDGTIASTGSVFVLARDWEQDDEYAYPWLFYGSGDNRKDFPGFIQRLLKVWNPAELPGARDAVEDVAQVIWELFENTFLHARRAKDLSPINNSIRGIFLEYQWLGQVLATGELSHMSSFFDRCKQSGAEHLLLMTIFDSGIGIPRHRRSANVIGLEPTEFEIVSRCFRDSVGVHFNRSKGLPIVAKTLAGLRDPGFALIRTGNVDAYLNGSEELLPVEPLVPTPPFVKQLVGTSFTVIMPYQRASLKSRR